jgi:CRISPR-associated endonuclease/helicase Cas3
MRFSVELTGFPGTFFAHSLQGRPTGEWQCLQEHLFAVGEMAARFAEGFGSGEWARLIGRLHDFGKAHPAFQAYLRKENGLDASEFDGEARGGKVNHSGAGALLATRGYSSAQQLIGKIIAYVIAGHHAGLPDWHGGGDSLAGRLATDARTFSDLIDRFDVSAGGGLPQLRPPQFALACRNGDAPAFHVWIRMLFSCLVDADFLDTETFMDPKRASLRPSFPNMSALKTRFDHKLETMMNSVSGRLPEKPINLIRAGILADCRRSASHNPGFFMLSVPTGGGKTLSGTAFALDHAVRFSKQRIVYVIPYTSIIEQTATVLRHFLGKDNVVEHHSNVSPDYIQEAPGLTLAAENWDAPVIVTTNVQFFESLFSARPGRCRKLHNLVNSVVILDEAHLLPSEWLSPCVEALNQLVENYGASIVFSTATQPVLPGLRGEPRAVIDRPDELCRRLKRTEISMPSALDRPVEWADLAAQLSGYDRVLCIVNRRSDCYQLWKIMPPGTIHLSALMCGKHRSRVIRRIKHGLKSGVAIRVISTQLVEAGVDIDFPVVFRALAGLDSINQAAGRCNREGGLPGLGEVRVFIPPKPSPPGVLRKGEDVTRELMTRPDFVPDHPAWFADYFRNLYGRVNNLGGEWLRDRLVKDVNPQGNVQFRSAGNEFRLIQDRSVPIVTTYGGNRRLLQQLRVVGPTREIMRALQRLVVNVPRATAEALLAEGAVEKVHDTILVQADSMLYDEEVGLHVFREGYTAEDLCV